MSLARLLVAFLLCTSLIAADNTLRVSSDGRSLVKADGSAFFWMGDTAWELFHRLNREQAEQYLSTRANQGYTIIQAVALAELDGLNTPNPYGHKPFTSTSPTLVPNDAYWQHVDWIVNRANALGLYIGLLPTWGDKWNLAWGQGPIIFDTTAKAQAYGQFIGNRYRNAAAVWIMGGDRNPANDTHLAITRAMAQGVDGAMSGRQLMTFHPQGGATSATWFHNDTWLDFNMQQNGHCTNTDVWNRITNDRNRTPGKPVLDGEPLYESHPICFNAGANGYSNATDVRKFAYWNVFAGAFGHTYGCHSVWQMYDAGRGAVNGPQQYWHQALTLPGAVQMGHVRRLMDSRPLNGRVPDQSLLTTSALSGGDRIQATRGGDGGYTMIYSASGQGFTVDLNKLSGNTITAWWFDPRSGTANGAGSFAKSGTRAFTPPSNGYGNDWVLVLDDAARGYGVPGGSGGGNPAPTCQLTAPTNGATYSAPATITLSATASDSNGSVARVEFYAGTNKLGEDSSAPYTFTWNNVAGGSYTLSARAVDNQGAVGSSASATVTVTTAGFVLGVNLGGGAVTIEGNAWRSDATGRSNGLTTTAPNVASTNVTPSPATDSATRSMLNSAIWGGSFSVGQPITNGSYDVYLWVIENYQSNYRRFDVQVEGATVASGIANLTLGSWVKYGPFRANVGDGRLDMNLVKVAGDPHLMGFAVFSAGAGGGTWSNGSVGSPGLVGSATQSGNTWTVRGGGNDIWNTADNFHYVHQSLNGDGEITVRVVSQTNTDPWAKAGVMIRDGLASNARHTMIVVTPGNGVSFQRRISTGGPSASTTGSRATAPVWLRLVRVGNVITGYESGTGSSWTMVGSVTLTLGTDVRIGLCVTSHNNGLLSTAVFDSVAVITAPGGSG